MVDYIVLAEFDIDKGSGVRLQHPDSVPGTSTEELAEFMITEGAHNFGVVSTYFSVGKRSCKDLLSEQLKMTQSPQGIFLDKIFTQDKKQGLLENFWVQNEQQTLQHPTTPQTRSMPEVVSAESEQLRYIPQIVKLYRIEDMKWRPYFQQGHERLVEFQLTCQNSTTFKIKLISNSQEVTSPILGQSAQKASSLGLAAQQNQKAKNSPFCIEIEVHPFLNFRSTEAQPYRASFENMQGYTYGIEIVNENIEERINFYKMLKLGLKLDPYQCFEQSFNQSAQTIFFFNVLKNRQNEHVKRGAIVKALAFGCKKKCLLEPMSQLIEITLDAIISVTDVNATDSEVNMAKYSQIISRVFHQVNQQASLFLTYRGNFLERAVSLDMNTNCAWQASVDALQSGLLPDSLFQMQKIQIQSEPDIQLQTQVCIPLATPPDQVTSSSLVKFINYFGLQTMVIYDAILSDKRIIFAGSRNLSITQIQNYLFTAASMVSPPLYGIHNKILPYVPLVNIASLQEDGGFLAGVTNPMFVENRRLYDVSIQIDEGKLNADSSYMREPYFELDKQFVKTLLVRIKANTINDEEIRLAFNSYTQLMLDLATNLTYTNSQQDSAGLTHNGSLLSQQYLNRTRRLKNTHLFKTHLALQKLFELDKSHSISVATIKGHMRTLRIKGMPHGPLTDVEVRAIFKDIDTFVQNKTSAIKLLYLLPLCRQGVGLLAHGLFFDDDKVQESTVSILSKIQKSCKAGAFAVNRLSEFIKMRFIDAQAEMGQTEKVSQ